MKVKVFGRACLLGLTPSAFVAEVFLFLSCAQERFPPLVLTTARPDFAFYKPFLKNPIVKKAQQKFLLPAAIQSYSAVVESVMCTSIMDLVGLNCPPNLTNVM